MADHEELTDAEQALEDERLRLAKRDLLSQEVLDEDLAAMAKFAEELQENWVSTLAQHELVYKVIGKAAFILRNKKIPALLAPAMCAQLIRVAMTKLRDPSSGLNTRLETIAKKMEAGN